MTIRERGYRRYTGVRRPPGGAWLTILRAGLRTAAADRRLMVLLIAAWIPFLFRALQLYIGLVFPEASFLALTPGTFRQFLAQQSLFVFFITIYLGSGLIAEDNRARALQIYLTRPLGRLEYVGGKLAILVAVVLFVTLVPALLLLLNQLLLVGSPRFIADNVWLLPVIGAATVIDAVTSALLMLALSSTSNSARFAGVSYAAFVLFTQAVTRVLDGATGTTWWSALSIGRSLGAVIDRMFGEPATGAPPWGLGVLTIVVVVAASAAILERRVRAVDVAS